jgi:hypothetical protein
LTTEAPEYPDAPAEREPPASSGEGSKASTADEQAPSPESSGGGESPTPHAAPVQGVAADAVTPDVLQLGPLVGDAPPEPEEPRERCSVFHPRLRPLRQCRLLDGHLGNHEF